MITTLDLTDTAQLTSYESAFYESFVRVENKQLISALWHWDHDARRLATKIPYSDQLIFVVLDDLGRVETGLACNVTLSEFQSSTFGFPPPADKDKCLEILTFFSVTEPCLADKIRFWAACLEQMANRGYRTAYATTAPRFLRCYQRAGWRMLEQREISGEWRYFLEFQLSAVAGKRNV
jgi:hypothetical protein